MKLFNKKNLSSLTSHFSFSKGFTLIELLIVIAILGILAAGVLVAINPVQKINQAKDANAKSDVGQIATALQAYYTVNSSYPTDLATLVTSNELKVLPTTTTYTYAKTPATAPFTDVSVSFTLFIPSGTNTLWCWRSSLGTAVAAATCPAP